MFSHHRQARRSRRTETRHGLRWKSTIGPWAYDTALRLEASWSARDRHRKIVARAARDKAGEPLFSGCAQHQRVGHTGILKLDHVHRGVVREDRDVLQAAAEVKHQG